MKRFLLASILPLLTLLTHAQPVPSFCDDEDSIMALYRNDAELLAFRKIYAQGLPEMDSVEIPITHVDTALSALIAVYNATGLAARDTVVDLFNIHVFSVYDLHFVTVAADSTLPWMEQLALGNQPTGEDAVDDLLAQYGLTLDQYYPWYGLQPWHLVTFRSTQSYNVPALAALFQAIPGVFFAEPSGSVGDGDNIQDSIYTDHVELVYSHGWGDCPSGCTARRFWKFNVYWDCSVEFIGSYGTPLDIPMGVAGTWESAVSVAPNPFIDRMEVLGITGSFDYILTNAAGQVVMQGRSEGPAITDVGHLKHGLYFLTVLDGTAKRTFKVQRGL